MIFVAPDGNKLALIKNLKTAAINWGSNMRYGHSTHKEAWTALNTNISAKLKYPLPACTLTEKECKTIMRPALKAASPDLAYHHLYLQLTGMGQGITAVQDACHYSITKVPHVHR